MTILEAVRAYRELGLWPVPIIAGTKKVSLADWPNLRLTGEDLPKHFSNGHGVGILNGIGPRFVADVDLDCPEAIICSQMIAGPLTGRVFGRKSKPSSHLLFELPGEFNTRKYQDPDGKAMLVELRGKSTQTLVPPTIHPSREEIVWEQQTELGKTAIENLDAYVRKIAAAALLARHYPPEGALRHEAMFSLAGTLACAGWAEAETLEFVTAVVSAAGDSKRDERLRNVATTCRKVAAGDRNVTGMAKLREVFGAEVAGKVSQWLRLTAAANTRNGDTDIWSRAQSTEAFLSGEDEAVDFLHAGIVARQYVTEVFAPRGLGKSLWALDAAVRIAGSGLRVLLLDRDNPTREVKARLRAFGAEGIPNLKIMPREDAPSLTSVAVWRDFPWMDFDLVIVDSIDSFTEGVGEQDSAKPSRALAPLLDIAHRDGGPAVVVLGNCTRDGRHSRGSGVVEDRADIIVEARDCTDFKPSGRKPWVEELPPADAGSWASRSVRRKRRERYRLGFIPTKFRAGQEPAPFVHEIDLSTDPWCVRDVTADVDAESIAEEKRREREHAEKVAAAADALVAEILRRNDGGLPPILAEKEAVPFLMGKGLRRNAARQIISSGDPRWVVRTLSGQKGQPNVLVLTSINGDGGGNTTPPEPAFLQGICEVDFRRMHEQRAAEIPPSQTIDSSSETDSRISAEISSYKAEDAKKERISVALASEILGGDHPETWSASELDLEQQTRPPSHIDSEFLKRTATDSEGLLLHPPRTPIKPRPVPCCYCGRVLESAVVLARHLDSCGPGKSAVQ
jgi:hypothetical protein